MFLRRLSDRGAGVTMPALLTPRKTAPRANSLTRTAPRGRCAMMSKLSRVGSSGGSELVDDHAAGGTTGRDGAERPGGLTAGGPGDRHRSVAVADCRERVDV